MATQHLGHACSSSTGLGSAAAGSQLFGGIEPILLWRSFGTTSGLPELVGESGDVVVTECADSMPSRGRLSVLVGLLAVLQGLPGMFRSGKVFRLSPLFGRSMSVRGDVVQLGGPLMVFVM
jgi:hypothetical protein